MSDEQTRQAADEGQNNGTGDGQLRNGIFEGYDDGEQPLQSYTVVAGVFNLLFAVFLLLTKGTGRKLPERGIETRDIVLLGVATHKLSDLIANDAVTSFVRAPFTELQEKTSPKSLDEKPRGTGFRRSIGELLTCKFCMGQWIASFFTYGLVFSPAVTRLIASMFAIVTLSDHLHQTYTALKNRL